MSGNRYCVEPAKSGRSSCKDSQCKKNIGQGELRIGKITPNPFGDGGDEMTAWYHAACIFNALKRARAATKKIESPDDLEGYDDLDKSEQKEIKDLIAGKGGKGGAKGSKKGKAASKKKKKDESEDEEEEEEEEEESEDEKPKKKAASKKKVASKKAAPKKRDRSASPSASRSRSRSRSRSPSPSAKKKKGGSSDKKYYEKDTKFWEVWQEGDSFLTRWGKIGSDGQTTTKSFKNEAEATKKMEALIRSKEKSGYELA